ncbi:MAG: hypothetical protein H7061_05100 [Bdellovibrionaceae bacterium]|nr:hypothetical protein [Bdellovibrio sp.]
MKKVISGEDAIFAGMADPFSYQQVAPNHRELNGKAAENVIWALKLVNIIEDYLMLRPPLDTKYSDSINEGFHV